MGRVKDFSERCIAFLKKERMMGAEWVEHVGWHKHGVYTYEYMAEAPDEPLARDRRAKAVVHADMQFKWIADLVTWEGADCMHTRKLGIFGADHLNDAMAAVEKRLSQLNMF